MTEFLSQFMGLFALPENVTLTGVEWLVHPASSLLYATFIVLYALYEWRRSRPVRILIKDLAAFEQQLNDKPLSELVNDAGFAERSLIRPAWQAFKTSLHLNVEKSGRARDVWSFAPPAAFFNSAILDHAPVNLKQLRATPDKLIGIGLLLTFLTLVMALSFASKKASDDVNQLTVLLLLTAGTKFLISIAGLGSAIVFRSRLGQLETRLRDHLAKVCQYLSCNTTLYTPEHLLVKLIEGGNRQTQSFEHNTLLMVSHINSAIDTLAGTVTRSITDEVMDRLEGRLSRVLGEAEQKFQQSVQHLVDDSMSAGQSFKKEIASSAHQFSRGVAPAGQAFAGQITASADRIDESRRQFEETIINEDGAFTRAFVDAGETFKRRVADSAAGFRQALEQGGRDLGHQLSGAGGDFREVVDLAGGDFKQHSNALFDDLLALKTDIAHLADNVGNMTRGFNGQIQLTVDKFDTIHSELQQISQSLRHLNKLEKALLNTRDSLTTSSFSVNTMLQKMDAIVDTIEKLATLKVNASEDITQFQEALERLTMTLGELESLARLRLKQETRQLERATRTAAAL